MIEKVETKAEKGTGGKNDKKEKTLNDWKGGDQSQKRNKGKKWQKRKNTKCQQ